MSKLMCQRRGCSNEATHVPYITFYPRAVSHTEYAQGMAVLRTATCCECRKYIGPHDLVFSTGHWDVLCAQLREAGVSRELDRRTVVLRWFTKFEAGLMLLLNGKGAS